MDGESFGNLFAGTIIVGTWGFFAYKQREISRVTFKEAERMYSEGEDIKHAYLLLTPKNLRTGGSILGMKIPFGLPLKIRKKAENLTEKIRNEYRGNIEEDINKEIIKYAPLI